MTILIQHPAVERLARELSLDPDHLLDACSTARVSVLDGVSVIALASELPATRPVAPQENQPLSQRVDERPASGEKTLPPPAPTPAEMPEEVLPVSATPSEAVRSSRSTCAIKVWTEERDQLLMQLREQGIASQEIFDRLCALPGLPIASVPAMLVRLSTLRRKNLLQPDCAPPPAEMPEEMAAVLSKPSDPPLVWTPERDRLLVDLRSKGLLPREIFPRLNALPGIPVGSVDAVSQRISFMRRQGVLPRAEAAGAAGKAAAGQKPETREPESAPSAPSAFLWTDERRELLRVCWERGDLAADIMVRLNELPGPRITHANVIYHAAAARQLKRTPLPPAAPHGRRSAEGTVPMTSADVWNWMEAQGENPAVHPDTGGLLRAANRLRDNLQLPRFYIDEEVIDGNLDFRPVTVAEKAA